MLEKNFRHQQLWLAGELNDEKYGLQRIPLNRGSSAKL